MNLSLNGYDRKSASFCFDGLVSPDFTVEMSGNMKVKTCSDGGRFCGVCEKVNGKGGVKADSKSGFEYLVTDIDTNKKTIGIIL